jgi:tetratricopeptide (TPR) repeat protein
MSENPRIDELRRRLDKDPSSIAFAQLAEEYRRMGEYVEAVKICRDGLQRHPGYLSAQVTLGRALVELKNFDDARTELEAVLKVAPHNLAAIRALADIHQQTGEVAETVKAVPVKAVPVPHEAPVATPVPPTAPVEDIAAAERAEDDPALEELEQWLAAIVSDRTQHR